MLIILTIIILADRKAARIFLNYLKNASISLSVKSLNVQIIARNTNKLSRSFIPSSLNTAGITTGHTINSTIIIF